MYQFFKLMHKKAGESDTTYDSIKELTIDVACSAGYHRVPITLKNGKEVMRTKYNKWDDVLVAKWFCHFEKMFVSRLSKLEYLKDYHILIIERTFTIFFNALQIDKITSNTSVSATVYACLTNRIGEVMQEVVSVNRIERFKNNKSKGIVRASQDRILLNKCANTNNISLDANIKDTKCTLLDTLQQSDDSSDLILDIKRRLMGNKLGLRLLDAMLYSGKKVSLNHIEKFMQLEQFEQNTSVLVNLRNAYRIIVNTLREYFPNRDYAYALKKRLCINTSNVCQLGI